MLKLFFQLNFGFIGADFLYRSVETLQEYYYDQKKRSHDKLPIDKLIKQTFSYNRLSKTIITAVFIAFSIWGSIDIFNNKFICILITALVYRHVKLIESDFFEIKQFIRNDNCLDYGASMAISYFHGYLKIVLPSSEEVDSKSIFERMDDYSDKHGVHFPDKRLFILLPSSMLIPPKITERSDILECANPLETILKNRAGIIKRQYHTCIYKIKKEQFWHIAVEYATPLLTYFEAMKSEEKLRKTRSEIFQSFHRTLQYCLDNDETCRNKCFLITFDDYDSIGNKIDIGELLFKCLEDKILKID